MFRIEFPGTTQIADLVHEIAATMALTVNMPLPEDEGRINKFWNGLGSQHP